MRKGWTIVRALVGAVLLLIALSLALARGPGEARATVDALFAAPAGSGDCSRGDPCQLQTALDLATGGETVYAAAGTYTGTGAAVVTVTESITLYGGWDGSPSGPLVRDPDVHPTRLDGEDERRVVYLAWGTRPRLEGLTILRGNATHAPSNAGSGGAIYSAGADPFIVNNVITRNVGTTASLSAFGGGICLAGGPARSVVEGNVIVTNIANATSQGKGGGLALRGGRALIANNTFRDNLAGFTSNSMGGGLATLNGRARISGNLIEANRTTPTGGGFGGGFYSQFGELTLDGNTFLSNTANVGALSFESNARITVTNNLLAQNASGVFLRGNAAYPVTATMIHNTIADNGDEGVYVGWGSSGYCTVTMTSNIVVSHATGIYIYDDPASHVTATHTLFYGNGVDTSGPITSTDEITGSAPQFVDPAAADYHLRMESPAVDAGEPVPWVTRDIDGDERPFGDGYDVGADEFVPRMIYVPLIVQSG
jgi:hypothetical protein